MMLLPPQLSWAFKDNSVGVGIGYFSQNFLNETTQNQAGTTSLLGEANYVLNLKYDASIFSDWFLAPQLSYTPSPRQSSGSSAKVTLTHLSFLVGKNINSEFDWYAGPGLLQEDIKGNGGTVILNNGTTYATFALPGSSSTARKVTMNLGSSCLLGSSRVALDLSFESAFSSSERTQHLMLSYAYLFGAGY